ncbi:MAG: cbb3-type cytochrome c oxidase subunit 3 [Thiocapsa sp.]|nr:cbb3-type cytochrome c oxidase subunit 3 [Thiocapsa sp.]MCG6986271.1 cbb3-type cytochrome c oxidase subunit 3 [Thiocapsa sp.]
MTSLSEHLQTDWQAMTANDWIGTVLTVVIFLLMIGAYFFVFRPKNRDRLESMKHIPFDEDNQNTGDQHGRQ